MKRLEYTKFLAQRGDLGRNPHRRDGDTRGHSELIGMHANLAGVILDDIDKLAYAGAPAPSGLSADERLASERLIVVYGHGVGYAYQMGLRQQAL
jgi:hypothetical protein